MSRDINPTKTTSVKLLRRGLRRYLNNRILQILQFLIDDPIAPNMLRNLVLIPFERHQLPPRGNINPINIRIPNRRRGAGKINLLRPGFPRHLHNLPRRRPPHDRIVHQQHVPARKLRLDGIELQPHALFSRGLSRHDEGAGDVAVFDKAFAEGSAEGVRGLEGAGAGGVGDGYDDVNVMIGVFLHYAEGKFFAHFEAGFVDRHGVHNGIGAGEVDVLEDARGE
mmetsp:Transcript_29023/g.35334  ORF Transcript_29023/g.35334 Transcript_29023/m.35334 type:complete len:224 (-) Transcript_29023:959-1630(-)